jgi:2,3-bisphosphoglycerate-dependent phosphoglycerate mutase
MATNTNYDLVIIRHGESEGNKLNVFTGWRDSPLSPVGIEEARAGGRLLKEGGFTFDVAFTSLQSRAIKTLWLVLEEIDAMWIPVVKDWHLNERHYGALQGKNKKEAVAEFGDEQVHKWRRSYGVQPPPVDLSSPDYPRADPRYKELTPAELPRSESLKDVVARVIPYYQRAIVPVLKQKKKVLVSAHGNSLRALLMHLEGLTPEEIETVNLPTAIPKAYKLNAEFLAAQTQFLGNPDEVKARMQSVANQTTRG